MTDTLKLAGQEPKRDLTGTTVHIAEYDRLTLKMIHQWPVAEYRLKAEATQARGIVVELLASEFPDPAHKGTRPLTEQDLAALRGELTGRLSPFAEEASLSQESR